MSPKNKTLNSLNAVYKFKCDCGISYIGECENLFNRIQDHQQPSKDTAVFNHTSTCEIFQSRFALEHAKNSFENRFNFLQNRFETLHRNLQYKDRTTYEALEIKLRKPKLNKQVKHKTLAII